MSTNKTSKDYIKELQRLQELYDEKEEEVNDLKVQLASTKSQHDKLAEEIKEKYDREYPTEEDLVSAISEKESSIKLKVEKVRDRLEN